MGKFILHLHICKMTFVMQNFVRLTFLQHCVVFFFLTELSSWCAAEESNLPVDPMPVLHSKEKISPDCQNDQI